ncbi:sugar transferase [Limnobacter parvus]|uniref:Sugar transferase n=1 Tax=Limnobacter parvus TaxID=2939690 RepID=A0ABT1XF51_9BURK|nr:sugar transferase [Limnobacter parvus]MCR2745911.1 sugar transferase [Limnobacter parvus]
MKLNDLDSVHASAATVVPYLRSTLKRIFDIVFSLMVLLLISPIWLVAIFLVSLDGGPVFYSQRRVGLNGQTFKCWKFRTMVVNAETVLQNLINTDPKIAHEWNSTQKLKVDPRITWVGKWLRRCSVDELPQFINVLNGTMSVVGPRPFAREQIGLYRNAALVKYLSVKPGLTGSWQVYARHDTTFACRAKYDELYVDQASFAMDLALVVKTPLAMLRGQ